MDQLRRRVEQLADENATLRDRLDRLERLSTR
jgi:cell division septum initiation protein DivIVA